MRKLKDGNSLLLSAPRRIGKSSFAKKLIAELENEEWTGYYLNLERYNNEIAFIVGFIDLLYTKADGWGKGMHAFKEWAKDFKVSFKEMSVSSADIDKGIEDFRREVKRLVDNPENGNVVFVFDELAVFLQHIEDRSVGSAENFLSWMRSLRQECRGCNRWIFCSSISIENYLASNSLNATMNDVMEFPLAEMPDEEAFGLIRELAEGGELTIDDGLQEHMLTKIGQNIPYYIQALFSAIADQDPEGAIVTRKHIDDAYDDIIKNAALNTWHERIKDYKGDSDDLKLILTELCVHPKGRTGEEIVAKLPHLIDNPGRFNYLMKMLCHDGYLFMNTKGKYCFRSHLLRDYWKDRFII